MVQAVALVDGGPAGIGSHLAVGAVSEVAGVATLPAYRRRGIGAAIIRRLVEDTRGRGATTIFLSAAGDAAAHLRADRLPADRRGVHRQSHRGRAHIASHTLVR